MCWRGHVSMGHLHLWTNYWFVTLRPDLWPSDIHCSLDTFINSGGEVSTCLNVLSDVITASAIYQWAACCLRSHGSRVNVTAGDYGSGRHAVVTAYRRRSRYFWHNAYWHMQYFIFLQVLGWEGRNIKNMGGGEANKEQKNHTGGRSRNVNQAFRC